MKSEGSQSPVRKFSTSIKRTLGKSPRGRRITHGNLKNGRGISQTVHKEAATSKIRFKLDPITGEIDEANFEKEEMFMNFKSGENADVNDLAQLE